MFEITANQLFRLRRPDRFLKRNWAGETVIYKVDARETHQLSIQCAHVLGLLEQSPSSPRALRHGLQVLMEGFEPEEVQSQVSQILETLSKLGVIEVSEDVL